MEHYSRPVTGSSQSLARSAVSLSSAESRCSRDSVFDTRPNVRACSGRMTLDSDKDELPLHVRAVQLDDVEYTPVHRSMTSRGSFWQDDPDSDTDMSAQNVLKAGKLQDRQALVRALDSCHNALFSSVLKVSCTGAELDALLEEGGGIRGCVQAIQALDLNREKFQNVRQLIPAVRRWKSGSNWEGQRVLDWLWSDQCSLFSEVNDEVTSTRSEILQLIAIAKSSERLIKALRHMSADGQKFRVFAELEPAVRKYIDHIDAEEGFRKLMTHSSQRGERELAQRILRLLLSDSCGLLPVAAMPEGPTAQKKVLPRPVLRELTSYGPSVINHLNKLDKLGRFFPDALGLLTAVRAEMAAMTARVGLLLIFLASTGTIWQQPQLLKSNMFGSRVTLSLRLMDKYS